MRKDSVLLHEKLVESLSLPKDLMLGSIVLSVTGHSEACIYNYRGLIEYEDNLLRILAKDEVILIEGKNLVISYYTSEEMRVAGRIEHISYL
jgi:sporulation protein YqfC